jgi:hypothetical protein
MSVSEWRLIETAPKDGSLILLFEKYSEGPFVGRWNVGLWRVWKEHVRAEGGWDGAILCDEITQCFITHWMPLPEPPKYED